MKVPSRKTVIWALLLVSVTVTLVSGPYTPFATAECRLSPEAARGKIWAPTCKGCHDIDIRHPAQPAGGPNLHDVFGSVAGTQSVKYGYAYTAPLLAARQAGVIWTDANLDGYLRNPESFLKEKTGRAFESRLYMTFYIGGDDASQERARTDVIAYLKTIKGQACD
jgi:cytochrome c